MPEYCRNCVSTPYFSRRQFLAASVWGLAPWVWHPCSVRFDVWRGLAPMPIPWPRRFRRFRQGQASDSYFCRRRPSQVDTWDPKPALARLDGQAIGGRGVAMPSPFKFQRLADPASRSAKSFQKSPSMWTTWPLSVRCTRIFPPTKSPR